MNSACKIYYISKRIFDFTLALFGLFVLFPVLILIGVLIKVTSDGPILHWSLRAGQNSIPFKMAKLRTLKNNSPVIGSEFLKGNGHYFTKLGKVLRKLGIDELPQLYNILKGEMSFVGPRPVILSDYETIKLREKAGVNCIKPGLTGLAQINGRNETSPMDKVKYDIFYMQNMSLGYDLKILVYTNYYLMDENILHQKKK